MIFTIGEWLWIQGIREIYPDGEYPSVVEDEKTAISRDATLRMYQMMYQLHDIQSVIHFQNNRVYN